MSIFSFLSWQEAGYVKPTARNLSRARSRAEKAILMEGCPTKRLRLPQGRRQFPFTWAFNEKLSTANAPTQGEYPASRNSSSLSFQDQLVVGIYERRLRILVANEA
jgi:hypothetical protein